MFRKKRATKSNNDYNYDIRFDPEYRRIYAYHIPKLTVCEIAPLNDLFRGGKLQVFDIGANQGLWSKCFLDCYADRTNKIHLFEPLSGNLKIIQDRIDIGFFNPFREKVVVNPVALSDQKGETEIFFDKKDSTLASLSLPESRFGETIIELNKSEKIKMITVTDYCKANKISEIDIVKIDTEGHEFTVLKGMEDMMANKSIKTVVFEFGIHQARMRQNFQDFWDLFTGHGYKMYYFRGGKTGFGKIEIEKYSTRFEDFTRNSFLGASIY